MKKLLRNHKITIGYLMGVAATLIGVVALTQTLREKNTDYNERGQ